MAFRMVNTQQQSQPETKTESGKVTMDDIHLIDQHYKNKQIIDNTIDQYKKTFSKEVFERETIIYDTVSGKWKIEKVKQ